MFYHTSSASVAPSLAESFPTEYFLQMETEGKTEHLWYDMELDALCVMNQLP